MKIVTTPKIPQNKNQSKTFLKYERLLLDIEKKQQFRANLQDGLQKASAKINVEFSQLIKETNLLSRDYIIRLDELAGEIGVGKFNREWFEQYVVDELDVLLEFFGYQDKVLAGLYEKYTGVSTQSIADDDETKELFITLSEKFGFEVDIKEFLEKGERAYFEEHKDKIFERLKGENENFQGTGEEQQKATKEKPLNKKTTEDNSQLAKDSRSIYMRLVKKFHPDLEKDPAIIDQKNEIIKQVTKAYQENDFYTLLKLQITYLDDNETEAEKIADDLLKRYNKILQQQLDDLNKWVHDTHFASGAFIADFIDKNGKFSPQKFAARRKGIEKEITKLKSMVADSRKRPKGWFKEQIAFIKQSSQQNMMEDLISSMFDDIRF